MRDGKQASRLLALSIAARERGDDQAADEFMKLAVEARERDERPVVQQQQQAQAKKRRVSRLRRALIGARLICRPGILVRLGIVVVFGPSTSDSSVVHNFKLRHDPPMRYSGPAAT